MSPPELVYEPKRKTWTVDEYNQMAELLGITDTERRYELINGEIYEKMSPQSTPHFTGIVLINRVLNRCYSVEYTIRVQVSLQLPIGSEPEPDFAVVREAGDYPEKNPPIEDIVLVMEVSDSTLDYDRTVKMEMYARAGVSVYWIVNVKARQLEIYTEPMIAPQGTGAYRTQTVRYAGEIVALPVLNGVEIAIDDLLPPTND